MASDEMEGDAPRYQLHRHHKLEGQVECGVEYQLERAGATNTRTTSGERKAGPGRRDQTGKEVRTCAGRGFPIQGQSLAVACKHGRNKLRSWVIGVCICVQRAHGSTQIAIAKHGAAVCGRAAGAVRSVVEQRHGERTFTASRQSHLSRFSAMERQSHSTNGRSVEWVSPPHPLIRANEALVSSLNPSNCRRALGGAAQARKRLTGPGGDRRRSGLVAGVLSGHL